MFNQIVGWRTRHAFALLVFALVITLTPRAEAAPTWISHGPWGGHVGSIKVISGTPSTVLAASDGGPFRSTDGGVSFQLSNSGMPDVGVNSFSVTASGAILAGMQLAGGLFRSTDVGLSWTAIVYPGSSTNTVAAAPSVSGTFYVASNNSIGATTDGGASWMERDLGFYVVDLLPTSATNVLAGTDSGVFRSTDSGANWALSNSGLPNTRIRCLASDPASPLVVYAGIQGGLYRSADAGQTWNHLGSFGTQAVWAILVTGTTILAGEDVGLRRSTNGGTSWSASGIGFTGQPTSFAIDSAQAGVVYAGGLSLGVWKSNDSGENWGLTSSGIAATNITTLVTGRQGPLVLAGTDRLFRSVDSGGRWDQATLFTVEEVAFDGGTTVVAVGPADVSRSTDQGTTWAVVAAQTNPGLGHLAFDPDSVPVSLYGSKGAGVIVRSTDAGSTFGAPASGLTVNSSIRALGVSTVPVGGLPAGTVFAAASDGIWISTNSGGTFVPSLGQAPGPNYGVFAAVDFDSGGRAVAVTDAKMFRLDPSGASWYEVPAAPGTTISLAAHSSQIDTLFAGTLNGVYRTTNGGATWASYGLVGKIVSRLTMGANGAVLHAAVGNRGVFELIVPAALFTLSPCRLFDTRDTVGPLGGPSLPASGQRLFPLAGTCGVPSDARSVVLNVTAVNPQAEGDLRLFAGDQIASSATTLHCRAGRTRANNAITSVSLDGNASVIVNSNLTASTDVVVDVVGFFR
ncbi:MAG: hypothetical protein ABIT01_07725 [Thermoanaerobaculia bacterium]